MRIVVKVGTSTLAYTTGRLNIRHTEQLVKVLSDLKTRAMRSFWCPPVPLAWAWASFSANPPKGHHHQAGLRRCGPV